MVLERNIIDLLERSVYILFRGLIMNYTEYTIAEIMINALKNGELSKKLFEGILDVGKPYVDARFKAIKQSINLIKDSDSDLAEQGIQAIRDFQQLLNKNTLVEEDLHNLLEYVADIERAENRCKEIVIKDWNKNLSKLPLSEEGLKDFKLLVRTIRTQEYQNERDYPIISTSLVTPEKMNVYCGNRRTVSLIYNMEARYLIAMSTRDSGTCVYKQPVLELPLHAGIFSISSSYSSDDYLKLFEDYYRESLAVIKDYQDTYGEILFDSKIKPKAVLLHENVRKEDEDWGRCYAGVYGLPIYRITRIVNTGELMLRCAKEQ